MTVYELVQRGDVAALKSRVLVDGEIDRVNDITGYTPLCAAVLMGRVDLVRVLLERGADPDAKEAFTVPLCDGARNPEMVKLLLKYKPKVDARDEDGVTPLMSAAAAGSLGAVKLLLKAGADPRLHDRYGQSALIQAADKRHKTIVKLLLPLSSREDRKRIETLELSREQRFPFEKITEVIKAIFGGKFATVKRLMKAGVPVDARDENGKTPLMVAANRGDMRIVNFLLGLGADPTLEDRDAHSPVTYAAMGGDSCEVFELLYRMATATQRRKAIKIVEQNRLHDGRFKKWPKLGGAAGVASRKKRASGNKVSRPSLSPLTTKQGRG